MKKIRGLVSNKKHCQKTHRRWLNNLDIENIPSGKSCGACLYFIPSVGAFSVEWDICSCEHSAHDQHTVVQNYGCGEFEPANGIRLYEHKHRDYFQQTHQRWIANRSQERSNAQCGGCCFYIWLEGVFSSDWGMCSNPQSPEDGTAKFEHDTCDFIVQSNVHGWSAPLPRKHIERYGNLYKQDADTE